MVCQNSLATQARSSQKPVNYSVTELEMFGLSINLHQWNHLIAKIDFDCATDHLAAVRIMHGKDEPKGRIGRILEKILDYTF